MSNILTLFQDKSKGDSHLYDNHALIVDNQYEPYLLTAFDLYFISIPEISTFFSKYRSRLKFNGRKRSLSLFLLILALPLAVLYVVAALEMLPFEIQEYLLIAMKEEIFLAAFALLVLWHDLATNYDSQSELPRYPEIDDFTVNSIEKNGVPFHKYSIRKPLDYFHPSTLKLLSSAVIKEKNGYFVKSKLLLLTLLSNKHIKDVFARLEINNLKELLSEVSLTDKGTPQYPFTVLQSFVLYSMEQAILTKSKKVYPEHIFLMLFEAFPLLKDVLQKHKIDFLTLKKAIEWYILSEQYAARTNALNINIPYYPNGGVADGWIKGYTYILDRISHDTLDIIKKRGGIYGLGHAKEINTLISILQRELSANALLVGDPGVGKSSIILGLSQQLLEGRVPPQLKGLEIKSIDINKLLALASTQKGGLPDLIQKLSNELRKQVATVLYFDNLEILLSTGTGEGTAISYLMPLLLDSPIPIVGTMTFAQYSKLQHTFPTLIDAFSQIRVDSLNKEDTFTILTSKIEKLENLHKISITFPALRDILTLTETYQPNKKFPKKAVELLEQAAVQASNTKERRLTRTLVSQVTETLTDIPSIYTSPEEAEKLLTLEKRIHERYVNQNDAVITIVDALKRAKTNIRDTTKPFGVFLFLGPSGVGKTELAKITAEEYFGGEFSLIRIDLSQIKNTTDIPTVINKLKKVAIRPYTLLLLDEFEKTTSEIHDIFMRLFDEGIVVTPEDETLYFNNTIIIATSNIGSNLLLNSAPEEFDENRQKILNLLPEYLKVELINRFDKVVVFNSLSFEHLQEITILMLDKLVNSLTNQGITAIYSQGTVAYITALGHQPGMGARPLKRAIQDTIENKLSQYILETQQQTGENPTEVNFDLFIPQS